MDVRYGIGAMNGALKIRKQIQLEAAWLITSITKLDSKDLSCPDTRWFTHWPSYKHIFFAVIESEFFDICHHSTCRVINPILFPHNLHHDNYPVDRHANHWRVVLTCLTPKPNHLLCLYHSLQSRSRHHSYL